MGTNKQRTAVKIPDFSALVYFCLQILLNEFFSSDTMAAFSADRLLLAGHRSKRSGVAKDFWIQHGVTAKPSDTGLGLGVARRAHRYTVE